MSREKKIVRVILLGHRSLAGKDTVGSILTKNFHYKRMAFADKLKNTVADLYDFNHEQMHGDKKDIMDNRYQNLIDTSGIYLTPRRILQIFGQQQRSIYPDIWAQYVFNKIDKEISELPADKMQYVITDFRFKNEYDVAHRWFKIDSTNTCSLIKQLFAVKVCRPGVVAKSGPNDVSEHDLDDFLSWDFTVENNGTLEDLKRKTFHLNGLCDRMLCE